MFGGIVESIGIITQLSKENHCKHLSIASQIKFDDINIGDSIAVNGVCLTVTSLHDSFFDVTLVPETLARSNLDYLTIGNKVNLERALRSNARIGGHYIQGHVDGMGEIITLQAVSNHEVYSPLLIEISIPQTLKKYLIPKGFISLDGMSITIIDIHSPSQPGNRTNQSSSFTVTLIPHTQTVTIAKDYQIGTKINIEIDMIGKYVFAASSKQITYRGA